jgi:anaerobic selenocysteine-containing dehydrogenase
MSDQKMLDRRGFLKGSVLFAAAALAVAAPAAAQQQAEPPPPEKKEPDQPKKDEPAEKKPTALVDKEGREYRVCDMCGGNMYVEERRWTCDQCGFSYEV